MLNLDSTMLHNLGESSFVTQTLWESENDDYNQHTIGFMFPNLYIYKVVGEVYNLDCLLKGVGFYYDSKKAEWRTANQRWYDEVMDKATEQEKETIKQLTIEKELV